jgi:hypothetical protein
MPRIHQGRLLKVTAITSYWLLSFTLGANVNNVSVDVTIGENACQSTIRGMNS